MNKEEKLANYYRETKEELIEQRRIIDFDMKNRLIELEKDKTTLGNLTVLRYKSEIQSAEAVYDDRVSELKYINDELHPILTKINADRNDPFEIKIETRSFFDIYLDDNHQIVVSEAYTKL
ncbi:hypothetical protein KO02_13380 [Sphingobacterium sp. ML3W]|uniref:hypothetical protein n=1 Tax=Sphingobacterium sp. ML3W TaxID=1538644 RepID=UPI0004F768D6|nr:hypothetical protein [Sphingobacterium sp. ML3W]AIM37568.1 hypothetical protein KO02_13380 [Sphingobacterium sp. ML3W]